jgi:hypothetical protein
VGGEKILTAELRRYLKHGHKFVEGWMLTAAGKMIATLSAVQEARHIGGNVAEIGIHHGKVFILLYLLTRGEERAVSVDLFANQTVNIDDSGAAGDLDKFRANHSLGMPMPICGGLSYMRVTAPRSMARR